MLTLRRTLFRLSYQLSSHRWNGWPLDYWLSFALVLVAGLASLGVVPGARATIYAVVGVFLALWVLAFWAGRNQYVIFSAEDSPACPGPVAPLRPSDRIELRATGRFEVEGKEHHFSELMAYFRSFATREHVVMAIVPPSRFLLLGTRPEREVGMWYIFFRPEQVLDLTPGTLRFGHRPRPTLKAVCQAEERQETVYLSFDDHAERQRVWADLQQDAALGKQAK
jgi:hypothetical protein